MQQNSSILWLAYAFMTVSAWGLYGVFLHTGQVAMGDEALGDLRVLRGLGRPVARVHLGDAADLSERLGEMARGA